MTAGPEAGRRARRRDDVTAMLLPAAERVFATMCDLTIYPADELDVGAWSWPAGWICAEVDIAGARPATMRLRCDWTLAREIAQALFRRGADEVSQLQMDDALCELLNVIAGNVKPYLEGADDLGLPRICARGEAASPPDGEGGGRGDVAWADYRARLVCRCAGHLLWLALR